MEKKWNKREKVFKKYLDECEEERAKTYSNKVKKKCIDAKDNYILQRKRLKRAPLKWENETYLSD